MVDLNARDTWKVEIGQLISPRTLAVLKQFSFVCNSPPPLAIASRCLAALPVTCAASTPVARRSAVITSPAQDQGAAALSDRAEDTAKACVRGERESNLLDPNNVLTQAPPSTAVHEGGVSRPLLKQEAAEALMAGAAVSQTSSQLMPA